MVEKAEKKILGCLGCTAFAVGGVIALVCILVCVLVFILSRITPDSTHNSPTPQPSPSTTTDQPHDEPVPVASADQPVPVPSQREIELYETYHAALWKDPEAEEEEVKEQVAAKLKVTPKEVTDAYLKVHLYRSTSLRRRIESAIRENLKKASLHGTVESIHFQAMNSTVTIKLKAAVTKMAIKRDLIIATGAAFSADPSVDEAGVWVVAKMDNGDIMKVASVSVKRSLYDELGKSFFDYPVAGNAERLKPWMKW